MRAIRAASSAALFDRTGTVAIEQACARQLAPRALMQSAGLAIARLALALYPHAQRPWIACGYGNNAGDGLEAAVHLKSWGKSPVVTLLAQAQSLPADAAAAYVLCTQAGVELQPSAPSDCDFVIDAILGIGRAPSEPEGALKALILATQSCARPVVAVDIPSGLDSDRGHATHVHVRADHTLNLLTLKPGCFTGQGRDLCGQIWFDDLAVSRLVHPPTVAPVAELLTPPTLPARPHASHKGLYGDVTIVGGAPGMTGAAVLAGSAALHHGAGRVFLSLLDPTAPSLIEPWPELMVRPWRDLVGQDVAWVVGCGGGGSAHALPAAMLDLLKQPHPLVLDADALNTLAADTDLRRLLVQRGDKGWATVATPHPLEAARLLGTSTPEVQHDRLVAAAGLVQQLHCVVVLKGSGTVVAAPARAPAINLTGNARLATAGTGDVLAGMIGAYMAQGLHAWEAACLAVYTHGRYADQWPTNAPLTAAALSKGRG
jgi:hydroxyethylthiazole kinase-like uncharacterized protein yjeF